MVIKKNELDLASEEYYIQLCEKASKSWVKHTHTHTHRTSEKLISFSRHIFLSCTDPWWSRVRLNKMKRVRLSAEVAFPSPPKVALRSQGAFVLCRDMNLSPCPSLRPLDGPQRNRTNDSPRCHSNDCKKHPYFMY